MATPRTKTATETPTTDTPAPTPFQRPRVEILNRRLQSPHGAPSAPVAFKEAGWEARWFNAAIASDHVWRAKQNGWTPVLPAELADPEQIGGYVLSPEGYVTRGERGQELLMKLPSEWRKQIQQAKVQKNLDAMRPGRTKRDLTEAAGKHLGDQAADAIDRKVSIVGDVTDQYERMHSDGPGAVE